jgi:hypothetical protein
MGCGQVSRLRGCKRCLREAPSSGALTFSFGSPEVELVETCLDLLEGIRHEIHRRGLTQPTKVRELAEEFVAFFAGLRDSTFGRGASAPC